MYASAIIIVFMATGWYFLEQRGVFRQSGDANQEYADTQSLLPEGFGSQADADDIQVAEANATINSYYELMSAPNSENLREAGYSEAAAAHEAGWLDRIGYSILAQPHASADAMPKGVGRYAGNVLYRIADFIGEPDSKCISTDLTGDTVAEGWIYHDSDMDRWVIIDPLIPTSWQPSANETVIRSSDDNQVTVTVSSAGSLSNPWWAYMEEHVEINNRADWYSVTSSPREFDQGIAVNADQSLDRTFSNGIESYSISILRGQSGNFTATRIGQQAQSLGGDMMALRVQTSDEDITPVFTVGD